MIQNPIQSNTQESTGRVMEHSLDEAEKRLNFSGKVEGYQKFYVQFYCPLQTVLYFISFMINVVRDFDLVRGWMHSAISMKKMEGLDAMLNDFSKASL